LPVPNEEANVFALDSREAMQAAEQRFESMGDEIPEDVRGRRVSVDTYEIVMDESV